MILVARQLAPLSFPWIRLSKNPAAAFISALCPRARAAAYVYRKLKPGRNDGEARQRLGVNE
jgi:hypothetical protein